MKTMRGPFATWGIRFMFYNSSHQFKHQEPVALSAKAEAKVARLIRMLRSTERDSKPIAADAIERSDFALHLYRFRRERARLFDSDLFGEAAWDILLILFCAETKQVRLTVSNVCEASDVPPTTALRWISRLESDGTILRTPHPSDGRVFRLKLSEQATERMNALLDRSLTMNFSVPGSLAA